MHDYAAYGLLIRSEIPLPELLAASSESLPTQRNVARPEAHIAVAEFDRRSPPSFAPDAAVWATPDSGFVDYPGTAAFLVRHGREILIDPHPDADPRLIRLFLLGPVLALLLHQRQFLVLHASAVRINGGVIAFVGEKGMGKSTMTAAFHARGHAMVADDLVAIDTDGALPLAYPGFPQLKLFPESAALLGGDTRTLPRVHPDFEKRSRSAKNGFATASLPLHRIFALHDADSFAIESISGATALMELVRHSYLLGFLEATGTMAAHFRQATTLAARVPIARLLRPRSLDALPGIVNLMERELERAA